MNHTITINKTITGQQIDDLMCSALEGGITYWCNRVTVVGGKYLGEYASDQISRGGKLLIDDMEEKKTHILTLEKLLKALKSEPSFDIEDHDAGDADRIVQKALFGEVVYA